MQINDEEYTSAMTERSESTKEQVADLVTGIIYNDVVDYFLGFANETGELITNLKLQKLVYYAQAWHLAIYSKPLFNADFEAWVHGPVIRDLYNECKRWGNHPIESDVKLGQVIERFDNETLDFLEEVAEVYMPYSAYELELMVHREAPWIDARKGYEPDEKCNETISEESMRDYYGQKVKN